MGLEMFKDFYGLTDFTDFFWGGEFDVLIVV